MDERRAFYRILGLAAASLLLGAQAVFAAEAPDEKTLQTRFTTIHYLSEADVQNFSWRITGKKMHFRESGDLAVARVDELVEKAESILDMVPQGLRIHIRLYPTYKTGSIAYYSHRDRTITVYADRVTDGVLAHEISHAVICASFPSPPPEKIQEILAQYVDRHLWDDL